MHNQIPPRRLPPSPTVVSVQAEAPSPLTPQTMVKGGRYNWRYQPERLVYLGLCEPRNGRWHQFEKVDAPGKVWCEVTDADLSMLEATKQAEAPTARNAERVLKRYRLGRYEGFMLEAVNGDWVRWVDARAALATQQEAQPADCPNCHGSRFCKKTECDTAPPTRNAEDAIDGVQVKYRDPAEAARSLRRFGRNEVAEHIENHFNLNPGTKA